MTISSSLNASVAGLAANATRLATIADNIANSSTYGYRRVETDFHSLVIGSKGDKYSAGGVRTTNKRLIDEGGALITTSNSTDLAVRGRGMLPVSRISEISADNGNSTMLLATTGSFRTNEDGLLTTESGLVLMGWPALPDGTIPTFPRDTSDGLEPIQINVNQFSGEPTTKMDIAINLPATETDSNASGEAKNTSIEYFDNLGRSENLQIEFSPTIPSDGSSNQWTMTFRDTASNSDIIGEYIIEFEDDRTSGGTLKSVTMTSGGDYDSGSGSLTVALAGGPLEIKIGKIGDNDGLTQLSDTFANVSIQKDGSSVGNLTSVSVDESGDVYASFDTGISRRIYQVPLVDLPNRNGLVALDKQTYMPSPESGSYFLWDAGDGPTGDIVSHALEESSTDVAEELTKMIQTQRSYTSNAKVIQTVDEMLQETTNIIR
ncbi:flagellar hook-basal body complex protein [Rhodobacteraceae bacterium Araon29]|tara:strand:+ start:728 stop:2029 length:1302 start_codon:yes stop_codon:yes gene_type:complete